jgi:hypothetical protein
MAFIRSASSLEAGAFFRACGSLRLAVGTSLIAHMGTLIRPGLLLLVIGLTGCAHKHYFHPIQRSEALNKDASVLVTLPADASFGKIQCPGSGQQAAHAVAAAFGKYVKRVDIMDRTSGQDEQLAAARAGNFDLLAAVSISHWEGRAIESSGRPDEIEIELRTIRVSDSATLNLGSVQGRSKWATVGGDSPKELLEEPLTEYIGWLFTPPDTPSPAVLVRTRPVNAPRRLQ